MFRVDAKIHSLHLGQNRGHLASLPFSECEYWISNIKQEFEVYDLFELRYHLFISFTLSPVSYPGDILTTEDGGVDTRSNLERVTSAVYSPGSPMYTIDWEVNIRMMNFPFGDQFERSWNIS